MNTIEVQGLRINYQRTGDGEPLLLLHGFPLNHTLWQRLTDKVQDQFDVIAIDLPGFGKSQAPRTMPWSIEMFADLVASFVEQLQLKLPLHLAGLSMGGYIAFEFQRKFGRRLASLTLCHTRPHADDEVTRRARHQMASRVLIEGQSVAVDAMLPKLFATCSYRDQPEVIEEVRAMIETTACESIANGQRAMAERRDATEWLSKIDCPVLVIAGDDDRITPAADMAEWSSKIAHSTFVEIPSAGHSSPLENADAVATAIGNFVKRLS